MTQVLQINLVSTLQDQMHHTTEFKLRLDFRSRVMAGLERAKARGVRLGRPKTGSKVEATIRARLATGEGIKNVAKAIGVGNGTVSRIKAEMAVWAHQG